MTMTIECPRCAHRYEDRYRASIDAALEGETSVEDDYWREASSTICPACARVIQFGLLVLEEDDVWRVSRYAQMSADVSVVRPPGGQVAYESRSTAGGIGGVTEESEVRRRAVSVIEGRAPDVGAGAQREAVELALRVGALDDAERARARAWLRSGPI